MPISDYSAFFTQATGKESPYGYQARLADSVCESRLISIPTGLGKTNSAPCSIRRSIEFLTGAPGRGAALECRRISITIASASTRPPALERNASIAGIFGNSSFSSNSFSSKD